MDSRQTLLTLNQCSCAEISLVEISVRQLGATLIEDVFNSRVTDQNNDQKYQQNISDGECVYSNILTGGIQHSKGISEIYVLLV